MYASIQNFGSFALKLTCSNYLLYDPACETVERKAVNYVSLIKIVFNIKHRHRFVKKWVYRAIIIVIWLTIVREVAQIRLKGIADRTVIHTYFYILFYAVSLFAMCVSYILITIKVRCSRHP